MFAKRIKEGMKNRLPGGEVSVALKNSITLYKAKPSSKFYKKQLRLNLRAFFVLGRVYAPLNYVEVKNVCVPPSLYHITSQKNLESICKHGLLNKKTEMVFLTDCDKYAEGISRGLKDPCVIVVDSEKMLADGYVFYENASHNPPIFWVTESVLPQYIHC